MKFEEFQKDCKYKTFQDKKCVHEDNRSRRIVGSCKFDLCPLKKDMVSKSKETNNIK